MSEAYSFPPEDGRHVPHNIEAEQALLGAVFVNNEAFWRVSDFLEPRHFYEGLHGRIFDIAGALIRAGKAATPITIKTFLPADLDIAGLTPAQYLARLTAEATTVINAADYGRSIHDLALRRALIEVGEDLVNDACAATADASPRSLIEQTEQRLYAMAESGRFGQGFLPFTSALRTAVDMAAAAYKRDGGLSGIATGLSDLDRLMGGLQSSDLIVLAGRPGMGKTALATNIAFNVAAAYRSSVEPDGKIKTLDGGVIGFFSLEMSAEQLATRIISEQSGISSSNIRRGAIDEAEFFRLTETVSQLQHLPLFIEQTGGLSIAQLCARARRLKRSSGLDLLVIDYIQLLSGDARRGDNRVQEVSEITTTLKALAKELNVPIIALSQLSRQVEQREDKRPQLSDLRESGSIEQDADVVLFVFREEYYVVNHKPQEGSPEFLAWQADMERVAGRAEVIIGKQRHGPTGTVELQFENRVTRFSDLAREDRLPERM